MVLSEFTKSVEVKVKWKLSSPFNNLTVSDPSDRLWKMRGKPETSSPVINIRWIYDCVSATEMLSGKNLTKPPMPPNMNSPLLLMNFCTRIEFWYGKSVIWPETSYLTGSCVDHWNTIVCRYPDIAMFIPEQIVCSIISTDPLRLYNICMLLILYR